MSDLQTRLEKKLLHYTSKAVADFKLIARGDKVMLGLSGGKDSFTLLYLLNKMRIRSNYQFELFSFTLDQMQPGWDDTPLRVWLDKHEIPHAILSEDTYSIVKEKIPEGKTYCSLCSRLRRGIIYRYAEKHGFNKIALGHHRDDLITTYLMSILYGGQTKSMPPKLLSDNKKHIVVRPLAYAQEKDIAEFARIMQFPIIPCQLCGSQSNLKRAQVKRLIHQLAEDNPKVPSNILHALSSIQPSQMMDKKYWDFKGLEQQQLSALTNAEAIDALDADDDDAVHNLAQTELPTAKNHENGSSVGYDTIHVPVHSVSSLLAKTTTCNSN